MTENLRKLPKPNTIKGWIQHHSANEDLVYDENSNFVFCNKCNSKFSAFKKSAIERHLTSKHHMEDSHQNEFYHDLAILMISMNIPWNQLNNHYLKDFFFKYFPNWHLPSESYIRKYIFENIFFEKMEEFRDNLKEGPFCISIDETCDTLGRKIVNILCSTLNCRDPSKKYLIYSKAQSTVNSDTIFNCFKESLSLLWGSHSVENFKNIILFTSDAAPYMLKAGKKIKEMCPQILHVTCIVHGIHRIAETIRSHYKNVDDFINNTKKVFLKAPSRVKILNNMYPSLPLPPKPIITRWGSWLRCVNYYKENWHQIKNVILSLDDNCVAVNKCKVFLENPDLYNHINSISTHYGSIPEIITSLESDKLDIFSVRKILNDFQRQLENNNINNIILNKFNNVFEKNPDLNVIFELTNKIETNATWYEIKVDCLKFASLTSVACERSFSQMNYVLNSRRLRLTEVNLEKIVILYCNK